MSDLDLGLDEVTAAPVEEKIDWDKKKAVIFIDQEEGKPNYEFIGVNGKGFQVMRGVEVTVPLSVVHVLENAVATRSITDDQGRVVGQQNYHAIPFRVIRYL